MITSLSFYSKAFELKKANQDFMVNRDNLTWFLDATCGFYIQLKIMSFIQNAGSGVLAKAA